MLSDFVFKLNLFFIKPRLDKCALRLLRYVKWLTFNDENVEVTGFDFDSISIEPAFPKTINNDFLEDVLQCMNTLPDRNSWRLIENLREGGYIEENKIYTRNYRITNKGINKIDELESWKGVIFNCINFLLKIGAFKGLLDVFKILLKHI